MIGFLHELGHAFFFYKLREANGFKKIQNPNTGKLELATTSLLENLREKLTGKLEKWKNKWELINIVYIEQPAAKQIGEVVRTSHDKEHNTGYEAESPISTTPKK
jgi:hypothetical protein